MEEEGDVLPDAGQSESGLSSVLRLGARGPKAYKEELKKNPELNSKRF